MFTGRRNVLLKGCYQGFANYYSFAAVEAVEVAHTRRVTSWVVADTARRRCELIKNPALITLILGVSFGIELKSTRMREVL